jgi:nitrogen-specific signal transduction histidine kinase/CheY-like chemotaxis protein
MVTFVRDISEQRRAETERRELEVQALRAQQFEALGVLAGGIAHDFNNLLMTILGRAGLVRAAGAARAVDAALRADLDEMEAMATRAATLCRQLLAYAGKGVAQIDVVDLAAVARAMEPMLELTMSKRIALTRAYGEGALIVGDAGQIRQVIVNLVTNAAEAIGDRAGTVALRISREADPGGGSAVLEVVDDGAGMDEATRARMFDPFFTSKVTGRGLGLAVVQGIVLAHRGSIRVESAPGAGTTLRLAFPALEAAAPAPPSAMATTPVGASALVVDDEPAMRAITADMLACLGFTVRQAANAREAIDAFASASPRLVILDLSLPDASGEEVLRRLRRIDPRARVIVASGHAQADVRRFLGASAVDGILTKPYGLDALSTAVAVARDAWPA